MPHAPRCLTVLAGLLVALVHAGASAQAATPEPPAAAPAAAASAASAPFRLALPLDRQGARSEPDPLLPAWEILGFQFLVNRGNRYLGEGREDYRVTGKSIDDNLRSGWGTDRDPFNINQLGHPYQGAIYHGLARATGHDYWQSLGYAFAGSAVWEIAGERTRPSRNDQVASGIGGTFLG
ncbi:MAG: DUF3943 domain-containing protein, partial [Caldimonas sp.]